MYECILYIHYPGVSMYPDVSIYPDICVVDLFLYPGRVYQLHLYIILRFSQPNFILLNLLEIMYNIILCFKKYSDGNRSLFCKNKNSNFSFMGNNKLFENIYKNFSINSFMVVSKNKLIAV